MTTRLLLPLILALLLCAGGCFQRVDAELAQPRDSTAAAWRLAGSFGGDSVVSNASDDPWQVRFQPGGFEQIAGVCATDAEVWVCDLGISRIQIFDLEGRFLRSIGRGMPIAGTLPTDAELFEEQADFDRKTDVSWQELHGAPWAQSYTELFRVCDVAVTKTGYYATDWTRTTAMRSAVREPYIMFVPFGGTPRLTEMGTRVWPEFVAASGNAVAFADSEANYVWLQDANTPDAKPMELHRGGSFNALLQLEVRYGDSAHYLDHSRRIVNASRQPGGFFRPGGVALAFDKLVACDNGNRRLQVFEARPGVSQWCKVVRVVERDPSRGLRRFEAPWDVDIAADGTIYVLDNDAREVAILDSRFNRIGSFGRGTLVEPYAIDLADDGRHCYITDRRANVVHHYARQ